MNKVIPRHSILQSKTWSKIAQYHRHSANWRHGAIFNYMQIKKIQILQRKTNSGKKESSIFCSPSGGAWEEAYLQNGNLHEEAVLSLPKKGMNADTHYYSSIDPLPGKFPETWGRCLRNWDVPNWVHTNRHGRSLISAPARVRARWHMDLKHYEPWVWETVSSSTHTSYESNATNKNSALKFVLWTAHFQHRAGKSYAF